MNTTSIQSPFTRAVLPATSAGNVYDLTGEMRLVACDKASFYHIYSPSTLNLESGILVLYDVTKYTEELHGAFVRLTNAPFDMSNKYLRFLGHVINPDRSLKCNLPTEGVHLPGSSKNYGKQGGEVFQWTQTVATKISGFRYQEFMTTALKAGGAYPDVLNVPNLQPTVATIA